MSGAGTPLTNSLSWPAKRSWGAVAQVGPLQDFPKQAEAVAVNPGGGHAEQQVPRRDLLQSGPQGSPFKEP